ncbi:MAG: hypothetical protein ABEI86_11835, partial [Halobacteriaceae archaeon]
AMKSKLVSKGVETEGDKVDGNPTLKNEIFSLVTDILPASLVQGLLFITPTFIDVFDFILLFIGIISVIILVVLEVYWRGYRVRSNFTVEKFGIGIDVSIVKNNK